MISKFIHALLLSHCKNNTYGFQCISHSMRRQIKSETIKHTIHINIDLLTSNGLIIKSRYHDFNDNVCIVIISLYKYHLWI